MLHHLPLYMDMGQARQRDKQLGQSNMFDTFEEEVASEEPTPSSVVNEWSDHDRLRFEKETIGFYVSGHPLTRYQKDIDWFTDSSSASISEQDNGKAVSLAGVPFKVILKTTRRGDKMALVTLEDLQGTVEVTLWPEIYLAAAELLASDEPILVKGTVDSVDNVPKVIATAVLPLSEAKNHWKGKVHVRIRTPGLEKDMLASVKKVLAEHQGTNPLLVHFIFPDNKNRVRTVESDMKIRPSDAVIHEVEALLGEESIYFE
jgi:DNA polymerase-3 subunit alpha